MFESREIAKKALRRAEEICVERKRKALLKKVAVRTGLCAFGMVLAVYFYPSGVGNMPDSYVFLEEGQIPLAAPFTSEADNEPLFFLPAYETVTVKAGAAEVFMPLINPDVNEYPLRFVIVLSETKETVFVSELLAPSARAETITLERPLEKGEYRAVLHVEAYEADSLAFVGAASVSLLLIAE